MFFVVGHVRTGIFNHKKGKVDIPQGKVDIHTQRAHT